MQSPDQIIVSQLEVTCHIGVPEKERRKAQSLRVSLKVTPNKGFAGIRDDIKQTVDYFVLSGRIQKLAAERPRKLIETLAEEIAECVLKEFAVSHVEVELRKYILPETEHVAVCVSRGVREHDNLADASQKRIAVSETGAVRRTDGKETRARLIYADSDRDPDMLYATGFFVPDAFVFLEEAGRSTIILNDLEVDRGRKAAKVDEVLALADVLKRQGLDNSAKVGQWLPGFLESKGVKTVLVPQNFPLGLARVLAAAGLELETCEGLFWAEREHKSDEELRHLKTALKITAAGLERGVEVVRQSTVGVGGILQWANGVLTSERLRAEIDSAVLRAGGQPANTIVAGGLQACDPHERGAGPLKAKELIIMDCFPRDPRTGFYGDMTRTILKGQASNAQRHLWETVKAGQRMAIKGMKPGGSGKELHESIQEYFTIQGFPTEQHKGRWRGFFHGTGHGLGLEIHEEPRFGRTVFKPGQVLTVEPGIYWPGVGGARIEDVVVVTTRGVRVLSDAPLELEV